MSRTYSVRVTQRPLGIGFITLDREIVVSEVVHKSRGYQLGLAVGDTLVSINDISLKDMDTYYIHPLPFKATFRTNPDRDINTNDHSTQTDKLILLNNSSGSLSVNHSGSLSKSSSSKSMSYSVDEHLSDLQTLDQNQEVSSRNRYRFNLNTLQIGHHLNMVSGAQKNDRFNRICFDTPYVYSDGHALCLLSSKGLQSGHYQWTLQIMKCDIYRQELGIIGALDPNGQFKCNMNGLLFSSELGARTILGCDSYRNNMYYASYNDARDPSKSGRTQRVYKDLSKTGTNWKAGDVIKIELDLEGWNISFKVNGVMIGRRISIEPHKTYYPCISFMGQCQYKCII